MNDDEIMAEAHCPYCQAERGDPCVSLWDRHRPLAEVHVSRVQNARIFKEVREKRAAELVRIENNE